MASFQEKTDWYGLTADSAPLTVLSDEPGESNEYNDYKAQDGSYTDQVNYGAKKAPSNELALTGDWSITEGKVKIGGISTVDSEKFALGELDIDTTAGELPTINASGKQVQASAATARYYSLPAVTIKNDETAQILWDAFTLTGSDCHLQSASYKCSAEVPTKDKNGFPVTYGVSQGVIECSIEIVQCGATAPTISVGKGWHISSSLASSNPDSDVPTWTATLRYFLTKTIPA